MRCFAKFLAYQMSKTTQAADFFGDFLELIMSKFEIHKPFQIVQFLGQGCDFVYAQVNSLQILQCPDLFRHCFDLIIMSLKWKDLRFESEKA